MKRYIDLDKAIERLNASPAFPNLGTDGYFLLGVVEDLLNNLPTADVADVRHGEWIGINGDQCSICGRSLRDLMDGDSYYSSEFE